VLLDLKS
jgi:hypothetical protein